jgi:hypothetical protein
MPFLIKSDKQTSRKRQISLIDDGSPVRIAIEFYTNNGVFDEQGAPSEAFLEYTLTTMAFGRGSDWVTSWTVSRPMYQLSEATSQLEPTLPAQSFIWEITFKDATSLASFMNFWTWPLAADGVTPTENVLDPSWIADPNNLDHFTTFRYFLQTWGSFSKISLYVSPDDESEIVAYWNAKSPLFEEVVQQNGGDPYEFRIMVDYTVGFVKNVYFE